jgi:hypothetical protein
MGLAHPNSSSSDSFHSIPQFQIKLFRIPLITGLFVPVIQETDDRDQPDRAFSGLYRRTLRDIDGRRYFKHRSNSRGSISDRLDRRGRTFDGIFITEIIAVLLFPYCCSRRVRGKISHACRGLLPVLQKPHQRMDRSDELMCLPYVESVREFSSK